MIEFAIIIVIVVVIIVDFSTFCKIVEEWGEGVTSAGGSTGGWCVFLAIIFLSAIYLGWILCGRFVQHVFWRRAGVQQATLIQICHG